MSNIVLSAQSSSNEIKSYFNSALTLTKSGEKFPVDLDDVWPACYTRKCDAIKELTESNQFYEKKDYKIIHSRKKKDGVCQEKYKLSLTCLEYLIARKVPKIFNIYTEIIMRRMDIKINNKVHRDVQVLYRENTEQVGEFMSFAENDEVFFYYADKGLLIPILDWLSTAASCEGGEFDECIELVNFAIRACGDFAPKYLTFFVLSGAIIHAKKNEVDKSFHKTKTYLMVDEKTGYVKIGKSINPKIREKTLQSEKPVIKILYVCDNNIEKKLHNEYKDKRIRGEWFSLSPEDIKYIVETHDFYVPSNNITTFQKKSEPCHEN